MRIVVYALVLASLIALSGCLSQTSISSETVPVTLKINSSNLSYQFETNASLNSTVFELLKRYVPLSYREYPGTGIFINSIGKIQNSKDGFWMFYVDGKLADVGVSSYLINQSTVIEMRYEKPEGYNA